MLCWDFGTGVDAWKERTQGGRTCRSCLQLPVLDVSTTQQGVQQDSLSMSKGCEQQYTVSSQCSCLPALVSLLHTVTLPEECTNSRSTGLHYIYKQMQWDLYMRVQMQYDLHTTVQMQCDLYMTVQMELLMFWAFSTFFPALYLHHCTNPATSALYHTQILLHLHCTICRSPGISKSHVQVTLHLLVNVLLVDIWQNVCSRESKEETALMSPSDTTMAHHILQQDPRGIISTCTAVCMICDMWHIPVTYLPWLSLGHPRTRPLTSCGAGRRASSSSASVSL